MLIIYNDTRSQQPPFRKVWSSVSRQIIFLKVCVFFLYSFVLDRAFVFGQMGLWECSGYGIEDKYLLIINKGNRFPYGCAWRQPNVSLTPRRTDTVVCVRPPGALPFHPSRSIGLIFLISSNRIAQDLARDRSRERERERARKAKAKRKTRCVACFIRLKWTACCHAKSRPMKPIGVKEEKKI